MYSCSSFFLVYIPSHRGSKIQSSLICTCVFVVLSVLGTLNPVQSNSAPAVNFTFMEVTIKSTAQFVVLKIHYFVSSHSRARHLIEWRMIILIKVIYCWAVRIRESIVINWQINAFQNSPFHQRIKTFVLN